MTKSIRLTFLDGTVKDYKSVSDACKDYCRTVDGWAKGKYTPSASLGIIEVAVNGKVVLHPKSRKFNFVDIKMRDGSVERFNDTERIVERFITEKSTVNGWLTKSKTRTEPDRKWGIESLTIHFWDGSVETRMAQSIAYHAKDGMKKCKRCETTKPVEEFYVDTNRSADAFHTWCKRCCIENATRITQENYERHLEYGKKSRAKCQPWKHLTEKQKERRRETARRRRARKKLEKQGAGAPESTSLDPQK